MKDNIKKIFIIGLPNTGKSQLFNALTDQYSIVANYPFTTVEVKTAKCKIGKNVFEVYDTPGLHSFYIHSEEELMIRDLLLSEKPDVIIQCVDAKRIKHSLTLTANIIDLNIPMVISLNSADETSKRGFCIDSNKLANLLGVSVIDSPSLSNSSMNSLKDAIQNARTSKAKIHYGQIVEEGLADIQSVIDENVSYKRKVSMLLLLDDPFIMGILTEKNSNFDPTVLDEKIKKIKKHLKSNISWVINKNRNDWISLLCREVIVNKKAILKGFSHTFAQLSRHPVYGIPILLSILLMMFIAVVDVANSIAFWMNDFLWLPVENFIGQVIPSGFLKDFLIGHYGILTFGISSAILTVIPILSVFFVFFNILEDIGYIPNLSVLLRRISEKIGLSGNSIMPVTLGFGCKTMATFTTRSLKSKKEKYIAIFLIAFALPCAPQMALNMSILGQLGFRAFFIAVTVLAFVEILAGVFLNKVIKNDRNDYFIQELPDIRMPNLKAITKKTYFRLKSFIKEAIPIFIYAAIILFGADKAGLLGSLKDILRPVVTGFLGFPIQMVDVLILCMARQEAAAALILSLVHSGQLNYIQSIVAVVLTTMFVPCLANMGAIIKEVGYKNGAFMILIINIVSILIAGFLNWFLIHTLG